MSEEMPKELWAHKDTDGNIFVEDWKSNIIEETHYTRTDTITPPPQNSEALEAYQIFEDALYSHDGETYMLRFTLDEMKVVSQALQAQPKTVYLGNMLEDNPHCY